MVSVFDEAKDAAGKASDVVPAIADIDFPDVPDVDLPDLPDLSDLPGFDDALQNSDEVVIDLIGDNDITTGDDDDLIVTGLGMTPSMRVTATTPSMPTTSRATRSVATTTSRPETATMRSSPSAATTS